MSANEIDERALARKRIQDRRDFAMHCVAYVVVNLAVWATWALTGGDYPWPIWMTVPWGIGLVLHGLVTFLFDRPVTEATVDRELERMHRH